MARKVCYDSRRFRFRFQKLDLLDSLPAAFGRRLPRRWFTSGSKNPSLAPLLISI